MRNGIPAAGLSELAHDLRDNPARGRARHGVGLSWLSGTRAEVRTLPAPINARLDGG